MKSKAPSMARRLLAPKFPTQTLQTHQLPLLHLSPPQSSPSSTASAARSSPAPTSPQSSNPTPRSSPVRVHPPPRLPPPLPPPGLLLPPPQPRRLPPRCRQAPQGARLPAGPQALRLRRPTPLLFRITGDKKNLAFTPLMKYLLEEEEEIVESMMGERVKAVRKLLMMSARRRIALAKLYHCRGLFGLPDDFRDRVEDYPEFFRVAVDAADGRRVLELVDWDPELAVSALERGFVTDEDRVRKTFKFPIPHGKSLSLDEDDERRMDSLSTLPLISPYSDGFNVKR